MVLFVVLRITKKLKNSVSSNPCIGYPDLYICLPRDRMLPPQKDLVYMDRCYVRKVTRICMPIYTCTEKTVRHAMH